MSTVKSFFPLLKKKCKVCSGQGSLLSCLVNDLRKNLRAHTSHPYMIPSIPSHPIFNNVKKTKAEAVNQIMREKSAPTPTAEQQTTRQKHKKDSLKRVRWRECVGWVLVWRLIVQSPNRALVHSSMYIKKLAHRVHLLYTDSLHLDSCYPANLTFIG